jgi:hypothetical protein
MGRTKKATPEAPATDTAKATNTTKASKPVKATTPAKPRKAAPAKGARTAKPSKRVATSTKSVKPSKTAKATKGGKAVKGKKTAVKAATPKISYKDWVIEAVQAIQTDDKPFISLKKIKDYIYTHIEEANPARISRYAKSAVDGLVESKTFKQKRDSVAFTAKAGDIATAEAPARPVVRKKPAPVKVDASDDNLTPGLINTTQSGRIALKRY